jgi:ribulose-phosphate 3-epimerase
MSLLGASIITMDHLNFYNEIDLLRQCGKVDYLHIDIMDGNFVPRYGIYPEIVMEISNRFEFSLDVHLMVDNVEFAISELQNIRNIDTISFHYASNEGRIFRIIDAIKSIGAKPVIALDLSTSLVAIAELLQSNELSGLLFMGIHPGVLQQEHRPENVIRRLEKLRCMHDLSGLIIQIDGAFNFETASRLREAGVNSFVGGSSSIYSGIKPIQNRNDRKKNLNANIQKIREIIDAAPKTKVSSV